MAQQPYPFNQKPAPTAILSQTLDGTPGGMNMALPPHEIDDTQARILVDWLVDQPGITRQRGPVQAAFGVPVLPRRGSGLMAILNPQGTTAIAALTGDGANGYFTVLSADGTTWTDLAWPYPLPTTDLGTPYRIVDCKPALNGGLLIGISSDYSPSGVQQGLAYWFGGTKANYTNATLSVARGSQNLSCSAGFTANVVPGMFLFANTDDPYTSAFIGVVLSVNSDSSITLMKPSPYAITNKSGTFQSIRGLTPKVATGEITCDTSSTTVTGGATKFISDGLNVGTWQIYRQSDGSFVGKVASVTSEISITLAANAAVSMADDSYIAVRADADFSIINTASTQKLGFLNSTYASRQWYANRGSSFEDTTKVWFSDPSDLESLDLANFDGDWVELVNAASVNEPIRGIAAAYNGLLIFKETETFILGGSSPTSFSVRKLEDDGALSGMSIQQYAGGVIWAGREGINLYDGVQTTNLVEPSLGQVWKDTIRTLDPAHYRLWSMINRDHYFLFLENIAPTFGIVKGNVSATFTRITFAINMTTRALTMTTNLDIRGSAVLPASPGRQAWYLVNGGLAALGTVAAVPSTLGGTFAAGTYYFKVTALDWNGKETAASAEVSAITTGTTGSVTLSWPAVSGAASYHVYRGTGAGAEDHYQVAATNSFIDTGAVGTALAPPGTDATHYGVVCDADKLFTATGVDPIVCVGNTVGPTIYMESKKFDAGDGMRLKRWKLTAMNYLAQDGGLNLDTVLGLNEVGQLATTTFPQSVPTWTQVRALITSWTNMKLQYSTWTSVVLSVFIPQRIRMQKKSQYLSFRLYGTVPNLTNAILGPYEVAYKLQRVGRV